MQQSIAIRINQFLRNITAVGFDALAIETFGQTVKETTALHDASVTVTNVTNISETIEKFRRKLQTNGDGVNGISIDYVLEFVQQDTDSATVEEAISKVINRLNTSLIDGTFTAVLRITAVKLGSTALLVSSSVAGDLSFDPNAVITVLHSARPTAMPSSWPTSFPSSQPSTQPTSSPTFSIVTKWRNLLERTIKQLFVDVDMRELQFFYDVEAENSTVYGGGVAWESFIKSAVRLSISAKKIRSVRIDSFVSFDSAPQIVVCSDQQLSSDIMSALSFTSNKSYSCDGHSWKIRFCSLSDEIPSLCVDCLDPCQNQCSSTNELPGLQWFSSVSESARCKSFYGDMKLFSFTMENDVANFPYVAVFYSGLWFAFLLIFLLLECYALRQKRRIISKEMKDVQSLQSHVIIIDSFQELERSSGGSMPENAAQSPEESAKDEIRTKVDSLLRDFITEGNAVVVLFKKLMTEHNYFRLFYETKTVNRLTAVLRITTRVAAIYFLCIYFMDLKYPDDDSTCVMQRNEQNCEAVRSDFYSQRSVCRWISDGTLGSIEDAFAESIRAQCLWVNPEISEFTIMQNVLIILPIVLLLCMLIMEPLLFVIQSKGYGGPGEDYCSISGVFYRILVSFGLCPSSRAVNPLRLNHRNRVIMVEPVQFSKSRLESSSGSEIRAAATTTNELINIKVERRTNDKFRAPAKANNSITDEELYKSYYLFLRDLLDYRFLLQDASATAEFDEIWALDVQQLSFDSSKMVQRNVLWSFLHCSQSFQSLEDFFATFIKDTHVAAQRQLSLMRKITKRHGIQTSLLSSVLLVNFLVDIIGRYEYESAVVENYLSSKYRYDMKFSLIMKEMAIISILVFQFLLIFHSVSIGATKSAEWFRGWISMILIAIIIDALFYEFLDKIINAYIIPSHCTSSVLHAKLVVEEMINQMTTFLPEQDEGNVIDKKDDLLSKTFSISDHIFVSTKLTQYYPSLMESRMINQYRRSTLEEYNFKWLSNEERDCCTAAAWVSLISLVADGQARILVCNGLRSAVLIFAQFPLVIRKFFILGMCLGSLACVLYVNDNFNNHQDVLTPTTFIFYGIAVIGFIVLHWATVQCILRWSRMKKSAIVGVKKNQDVQKDSKQSITSITPPEALIKREKSGTLLPLQQILAVEDGNGSFGLSSDEGKSEKDVSDSRSGSGSSGGGSSEEDDSSSEGESDSNESRKFKAMKEPLLSYGELFDVKSMSASMHLNPAGTLSEMYRQVHDNRALLKTAVRKELETEGLGVELSDSSSDIRSSESEDDFA